MTDALKIATGKLITCLLLLFTTTVCSHSQNTEVFPGKKPVTYSISQGNEKKFSLHLEPGKSYSINAEQLGIDIELTLLDKNGKTVHYQDSPNGKYGPEQFELVVDSLTPYLLTIHPLVQTGNAEKGKFILEVKEIQQHVPTEPLVVFLTPKQMRSDLDIFRKIREKANSGMYRYRTVHQTDSVYTWAYTQVKKTMPVTEFYKILLVLTDFEGSCHNSTSLPGNLLEYIPENNGYFPYHLKLIENKMVVNNNNSTIPLGSTIVSINGVSDTSIMRSFYKYFTTDGYNTTQKKLYSVEYSFGWRYPFEFGIQDSFRVEYILPYTGKILSVTIPSISREEKVKNFSQRHSSPYDSLIDPEIQNAYSFQYPDKNIGLLNIRSFGMASNDEDPDYKIYCEFLDSIFKFLKQEQVGNLIIDLRGNPGGNGSNSERLFSYLASAPYRENTEAYISYKKVPYPAYYVWNSSYKQNRKKEQKELEKELNETYTSGKDGKYFQDPVFNPWWQPDSNYHYNGQIYLLIDENVASAASHFASYIRGYTNAIVIGMETTGGYYGHNGHTPVEYELPNSKIRTRFSIVHITQDAPFRNSQPVGRGIIPDIELSQSFEDFMNNTDTQMRFTLDLIRK